MNRILLLLDHRANRRLLAECLAARYQILPDDPPQGLDGTFDLAILDGTALDRLWERVQARKQAEQPTFLPCLLVTARQDVGLVTRHLWKSVDELVVAPIEKVELQARVEILLRARRLSCELRVRAAELAEVDRRKDQFLATLAHELRNPLAPIRNASQLLRLKCASDPVVEQMGAMLERQVATMGRLLDDLLDMSRVSRGTVELRKERIDLNVIAARAAETVRPSVKERGHRLTVALPPSVLAVEADPTRLEQVVTNLLTNAVKYTEPGGHISLVTGREEGQVLVRVRDDGIGIRAEHLAHIFDLFAQADRVAGRMSEGLGIGLTLVRNLVEMHGGTVEVHSDGPGTGSEFVVRLPALPEAAVVVQGPVLQVAAPAARPLRVLITDDNADAAESLALLLRLGGHEVRTACDGPQALEAARSFRPQVVFLDIGLPRGMDGYQVARRLRQETALQGALLVAVTGYGQPEDIERARAAGMKYHLTKPADPAAVWRLLAAVQDQEVSGR